jgi:hypothetical protein
MNALAACLAHIHLGVYSLASERASARIYTHTPFDLYDNTSGTRMGGVGGGWPNFPSALNKLPPAICGLQTGAALTAQYVFCILLCVRHMEAKFICVSLVPVLSHKFQPLIYTRVEGQSIILSTQTVALFLSAI